MTSGSPYTIINSVFSDNSNPAGGSTITVSGSSTTIKLSKFDNCTTTSNGGAILVSNGGVLDVTSSSFYGNSAAKDGGAIYIEQQSLLSIFDSDFRDNNATSGGAYACDSTGHFHEVGCTFENSPADSCSQIFPNNEDS